MGIHSSLLPVISSKLDDQYSRCNITDKGKDVVCCYQGNSQKDIRWRPDKRRNVRYGSCKYESVNGPRLSLNVILCVNTHCVGLHLKLYLIKAFTRWPTVKNYLFQVSIKAQWKHSEISVVHIIKVKVAGNIKSTLLADRLWVSDTWVSLLFNDICLLCHNSDYLLCLHPAPEIFQYGWVTFQSKEQKDFIIIKSM